MTCKFATGVDQAVKQKITKDRSLERFHGIKENITNYTILPIALIHNLIVPYVRSEETKCLLDMNENPLPCPCITFDNITCRVCLKLITCHGREHQFCALFYSINI